MSRPRVAVLAAAVLLVAVALGTFASPFASSSPDGLTRVAQDEGFLDRERPHAWQAASPIEGYALPGVAGEKVATGLAGLTGTLLVFAVAAGGALLLRSRRRPGPGPAAAPAGDDRSHR